MKYFICIIICVSFFTMEVRAQDTDFSYQIILEIKGEYSDTDKNSLLNPDNAMRIEEFTSITQLYPIFSFRHKEEKFSSLLQIEGNFCNYNFMKDSLTFSFQEIYTQFVVNEKHFFYAGKRRLNWGSGMLWNPTNFYTQKDPFRTQNRLEGIFQAGYSILFPSGSLQAYVFPERKLRDFSYALKYDHYGHRIDASVMFLQHGGSQQFGYSVSYGGNQSTWYSEGVLRNFSKSYKVDRNGNLIAPQNGRTKFFAEVVGGFSANLNAHFSLRGEYRYREDYLNKEEVKLFKNALPLHTFIYDPIGIGRHTLFGSLEWKELYERFFIQLRSFLDPVSGQLIVSPLLIWKRNNLQIEVSSMIYNNALPLLNYQGTVLLSYHF